MPRGRRGSYARGPRPVVNSIKNVFQTVLGISGTLLTSNFAKAVTTPSPTVTTDVSHGCIIKAVWISLDVCGLAGTGVQNNASIYMMKNPGANLTAPGAESVGGSNEKKFIFKQWHAMIMRNQDGNVPYHWEGWIKIPKRYQRMGTDDLLLLGLECTTALTGHFSYQAIYKWYR